LQARALVGGLRFTSLLVDFRGEIFINFDEMSLRFLSVSIRGDRCSLYVHRSWDKAWLERFPKPTLRISSMTIFLNLYRNKFFGIAFFINPNHLCMTMFNHLLNIQVILALSIDKNSTPKDSMLSKLLSNVFLTLFQVHMC
jgi:hypothetical protein